MKNDEKIQEEEIQEEEIQEKEFTDLDEEKNETVENLDESEDLEEKIKNEQETCEQKDFEKLNEDFDKVSNSYQRLLADFENHKRRTAQEVLDERVKGKEEVLKQILDIVDNFDRALQYDINTEEFKNGIEMVHKMLNERLELVGLNEVSTKGELNPDIHQAVAIDNVEGMEDNHIIETLQKGYYVEEKLIRPAMVKVNKK